MGARIRRLKGAPETSSVYLLLVTTLETPGPTVAKVGSSYIVNRLLSNPEIDLCPKGPLQT